MRGCRFECAGSRGFNINGGAMWPFQLSESGFTGFKDLQDKRRV